MFLHVEFRESARLQDPYDIIIYDSDWDEARCVQSSDKTLLSVFVSLICAYKDEPTLAANVARWFIKTKSSNKYSIQIDGVVTFMQQAYPSLNYATKYHQAIVDEVNKFENLK